MFYFFFYNAFLFNGLEKPKKVYYQKISPATYLYMTQIHTKSQNSAYLSDLLQWLVFTKEDDRPNTANPLLSAEEREGIR